ncbi:hypothetical protein NDU88_001987 [Pleurodeles waltl]|uniref:Uncharacterized protein n=1 Tax=Pleurodeles waltl TaxID=8319 RepID=A0AAV7VY20_PLEWA|nr:hypothetical protein NDU88_001987 [Pleurodeles waltl]
MRAVSLSPWSPVEAGRAGGAEKTCRTTGGQKFQTPRVLTGGSPGWRATAELGVSDGSLAGCGAAARRKTKPAPCLAERRRSLRLRWAADGPGHREVKDGHPGGGHLL